MGIVFLALLLTAAAPEMKVETVEGRQVAGTLVELTSTRVTIDRPEGRVSLDTDKLLSVSPKQKPAMIEQTPGAWVELIDGSSLVAREYAVHERQAQVTLMDGQAIAVPTQNVGTVRLQASSDTLTAEWARIAGTKRDTDLLVVRKGDSLDYHKGVLHDIDERVVHFDLDGEAVPVKRGKVFALAYYHPANRELPPAVCYVTDAIGSRWAAQSIALAEDFRWTTPTGVTVSRPAASVVNIDFSAGKIVYLSDLKAESVQWTPYFGDQRTTPGIAALYAPRQDQGLESKPLQLDGKQYAKGLALHSRTELVFRLPDRFSRFKAIAGIDDAVRPHGSVRLVIRGDDTILLEKTIAGNEPSQALDLDLREVRRLVILADFGDTLDVAGHLDLCNARIVK